MRFTINASQPMSIMAASELLVCCSARDVYLFVSFYFTLCPLVVVVVVYLFNILRWKHHNHLNARYKSHASNERNKKRITQTLKQMVCGIHNASKHKHKHTPNWIGRLREDEASWIINYVDKNRSDIKLVSYSVCVWALHTTASSIIRHLQIYFLSLFHSNSLTHTSIVC